jgi:septum formation protein
MLPGDNDQGMKLVLASQSPRRRELLERAGFQPEIRVSNIVEQPQPGEAPPDYVRRLAREKAAAVPRSEDEVVLAADTIVVLDGYILEKPSDETDAARMLRSLSGRTHQVFTAICLRNGAGQEVDLCSTEVTFHPLTESEIAEYIASGEPFDKAGAYGIQGRASKFVERIDGCFFNVMGLPVSLVYRHLKARGL